MLKITPEGMRCQGEKWPSQIGHLVWPTLIIPIRNDAQICWIRKTTLQEGFRRLHDD
jgi:hypothetical protein